MREWHDPSTWLSASAAAAGLMLAGEGNGRADKVWAPTESIEPTALHLSLEGGWRGVVHGIKGTIMLGRQEMKKALKDRDFEKKNLPHRWFLAPTGLSVDFVTRLYVEVKWKAE